jgi:hypothetical protein
MLTTQIVVGVVIWSSLLSLGYNRPPYRKKIFFSMAIVPHGTFHIRV